MKIDFNFKREIAIKWKIIFNKLFDFARRIIYLYSETMGDLTKVFGFCNQKICRE